MSGRYQENENRQVFFGMLVPKGISRYLLLEQSKRKLCLSATGMSCGRMTDLHWTTLRYCNTAQDLKIKLTLVEFLCLHRPHNRTMDFEVNVMFSILHCTLKFLELSSQSRSLLQVQDLWFDRRNITSEDCLTRCFNEQPIKFTCSISNDSKCNHKNAALHKLKTML